MIRAREICDFSPRRPVPFKPMCMESIFHEKQEGQLCAQHCLNNLLQGAYFTAVDLAKFARELDDAEMGTMAEGGVDSAEFVRFMQQPSANMDDSGYFSVQVICEALVVWCLSMVPLSSPEMKSAMETPTTQTAFICNHEHHWFTIRKLGKQWFNLDSLQRRPELISDTYLKLFLNQLQLEGYSIFVVQGSLPECEADQLLSLIPIPSSHSHTSSHASSKSKTSAEEEDYALELAMAMSASMNTPQESSTAGPTRCGGAEGEGVSEQSTTEKPVQQVEPLSLELLRRRRLDRFSEPS